MPINIDKALGALPDHLALYGKRSTLLASNIANADTPGFKARDIDFRSVLARTGSERLTLETTNRGHISTGSAASPQAESLYRIPNQPALDGNTVDTQVEQAEFTENAVRYQSTLTFLNGRFASLKLAIKGQ